MVTKLRKFSVSKITKSIAFSLTVILITTVMLLLSYIYNTDSEAEAIFVKDYTKSNSFINWELPQAINEVVFQISNDTDSIYPDPDYLYYITDGENIKKNADLDYILEQKDYLYKYINFEWEYGDNTYKYLPNYRMDKYTLYLVFPKEYLQRQQEKWDIERERLMPIVNIIVLSVIVGIICIILNYS